MNDILHRIRWPNVARAAAVLAAVALLISWPHLRGGAPPLPPPAPAVAAGEPAGPAPEDGSRELEPSAAKASAPRRAHRRRKASARKRRAVRRKSAVRHKRRARAPRRVASAPAPAVPAPAPSPVAVPAAPPSGAEFRP
jgi:hypothetical protein